MEIYVVHAVDFALIGGRGVIPRRRGVVIPLGGSCRPYHSLMSCAHKGLLAALVIPHGRPCRA